jgi:hypothetical protein
LPVMSPELKKTISTAALFPGVVDWASKYQKSADVRFAGIVILKPSRLPGTEAFSTVMLPFVKAGLR